MANKKRFMTEFSNDDPLPTHKPADYQARFAGNIDDCFRIGISFTRQVLHSFQVLLLSSHHAKYHHHHHHHHHHPVSQIVLGILSFRYFDSISTWFAYDCGCSRVCVYAFAFAFACICHLILVHQSSDKDRDYDFLSSIELVVLDQAEMFAMQNWDHLSLIMEHLNLRPTRPPETCDFSRLRPWYNHL